MKQLKVKPAHLAAGLQKVLKAKSLNTILPAVECVHARTSKDGLILTCTDLETTITTGIVADTTEAGIEFLIPPQAYTVINYLKDEETDIVVTINKNQLSFTYNDNVMKFEMEDVVNFPKPPAHKKNIEFSIEDASELKMIFDDCLKFTSNDDLRPAMTGVYFTEKEIAATDAHRLLRVKYKAPVEGKKKFAVILPKSFVRALPILDNKYRVEISDSFVTINDDTTKIVSRIIDAQFPKYEAVIPKESEYHISINAAEVKRNIRIASTLTTKDRRVIFNFKKTTYTIKGYDADLAQEITLNGKCQVAHNEAFKGLEIAFNGTMLTQLLEAAANADIIFELSAGSKPLVVNEDKYTLLLMPIRLINEDDATKNLAAAATAAASNGGTEAGAAVAAQAAAATKAVTPAKKKVVLASSERLN